MSGGKKNRARIFIAALYALTMMFVSFSASSHMNHVVASSLDARADAVESAKLPIICSSSDFHDEGGSESDSMSCCDACTLTSASGLNVVASSHLIYALEISARFEFASRFGRGIDARPDDLRSRAPPRLS